MAKPRSLATATPEGSAITCHRCALLSADNVDGRGRRNALKARRSRERDYPLVEVEFGQLLAIGEPAREPLSGSAHIQHHAIGNVVCARHRRRSLGMRTG